MTSTERHNINRTAGAGGFTQAEIDASKSGAQFLDVTPEMLFSSKADARLALRLRQQNPVRYAALKQEWRYITGQDIRPASDYDR